VFYSNYTPETNRFRSRGMGQTDGRTDERMAATLNAPYTFGMAGGVIII